jgi:hypothetical protein
MTDPANPKMLAGAIEAGDLPDLGISGLVMRVDTGAAISSLHVDNIKEFRQGGRLWVSFDLLPGYYNVAQPITVKALVKGRKKIKSSSADMEKRVMIVTNLSLGGHVWSIKLTLTNRADMTYLMLLGREAMTGRLMVDPDQEFLLGNL